MNEDQPICLCFDVSRRKVIQFLRTQKPKAASQMSECFGAGTGCGWCRKFLEQLWQSQHPEAESFPDAETYAQQRQAYKET
ncbi:MAG: (2Fe-2S)-binding protein [Planctomycetota bacterium]